MKKAKSTAHKNKSKKQFKIPHRYFLGILLVILLATGPYLFYNLTFKGKIFPNIYAAGVYIGGLKPDAAKSLLAEKVGVPEKITLTHNTNHFDLNSKEIGAIYDYGETVDRAYDLVRTGNFFYDTVKRIELLTTPKHLGLSVNFNEDKLSVFFQSISNEIAVDPIYPSIKMAKDGIVVDKGVAGMKVDANKLRQMVGASFAGNLTDDVNIPTTPVDPTLNDIQAESAKTRAENFLDKTLTIKFEFSEYSYKTPDLLKLVNPAGGFYDTSLNDIVYKIAKDLNRIPQDPKFQFDGKRVTEFAPALEGIEVDAGKLRETLNSRLEFIEQNSDKIVAFEVPVKRTDPNISTEEVNNLGIKELIGRGISTYYHSIPGRIFNVNLAASRINGTLVSPGETFSFNQTLGDVSKETGYKEAYVISQGKTILGDGGGVCQVSTTLFRAVLNAGLPVTDRTAHAYRVGYYEQNSPPGIDATVYGPRPDFKFTNDTDSHILIVAKNNPKNFSLVFELYGTSDGRTASISKPVVTNVIPALPTVYQDDPTLPAGTTKQVDYAASGARVTFNYLVTRNGQEIYKRTFVSNYQPWAAVYLRGTKI